MPQKGQAEYVLSLLIDSIAQNPAIGSLINAIKIQADPDPSKSLDQAGKVLPIIVIYPAGNKKLAEELLGYLVALFRDKNIKESGITPRYNIEFVGNLGLIYYAQSDADYKNDEILQKFFAPTDYALYKTNFTGKDQDYNLKFEQYFKKE